MNSSPYIVLDKPIGKTPLEAVEEWRAEHPEYVGIPLSYAGRLDPMASGLLLVLIGDECKRQDEYTKLNKEYEIEVLLGIGSDTGDILGLVAADTNIVLADAEVAAALSAEVGTHLVPYPVYSSKTVTGKPLFMYALENTIDTIEIPTHEETIHSIELLSSSMLSGNELMTLIKSFLDRAPKSMEPSKALGADFRIEAVRTSWKKIFDETLPYQVLKLRVACASGTYMRSLAGRLGAHFGTSALALSIRRTKIGTISC